MKQRIQVKGWKIVWGQVKQGRKDGAYPEDKLTQTWKAIQSLGNCYGDDFVYPPNMKECTAFDIMPNSCSSCHDKEFPKPGVFDDTERNKLLEGEKRYQRFIDASK